MILSGVWRSEARNYLYKSRSEWPRDEHIRPIDLSRRTSSPTNVVYVKYCTNITNIVAPRYSLRKSKWIFSKITRSNGKLIWHLNPLYICRAIGCRKLCEIFAREILHLSRRNCKLDTGIIRPSFVLLYYCWRQINLIEHWKSKGRNRRILKVYCGHHMNKAST